MQAGVGVRMADQGLVVVDPYATQPDRFAVAPAVGVEALTDAHLAGDQGLGHGEVLREGEFHQARIAADHAHRPAVRLDH